MKVLTVWRVYEWDGGELTLPTKFVFTDPAEVEAYRKEYPNNTVVKDELFIFDSCADLKNFKSGEVRKKALAKLTPEERASLGLPVEI